MPPKVFETFQYVHGEAQKYKGKMCAYEIRFSFQPPGDKYRKNKVAMVLAETVEGAIAAVKAAFPDDTAIHAIQMRSSDSTVIIANGSE